MKLVPGTSFIEPFSVGLDLEAAVMEDPSRVTVRKASAMRGYYADPAALERLIASGDPIHYKVYEVPVPEEYGHLMYCISELEPGLVGDEYFMTKGHYHSVVQTGEIYLCLRGEGFMVMKTADGRVVAEPMARNRMVYVPPYWAHRSVNTGTEPLVSFCIYGAEAGHNYGDIETEGFGARMLRVGGKPELRP
jgi:glucose-6-phosphate isomerase, archaeal